MTMLRCCDAMYRAKTTGHKTRSGDCFLAGAPPRFLRAPSRQIYPAGMFKSIRGRVVFQVCSYVGGKSMLLRGAKLRKVFGREELGAAALMTGSIREYLTWTVRAMSSGTFSPTSMDSSKGISRLAATVSGEVKYSACGLGWVV